MNKCNLVQIQPKENVFRGLAGVMEKDGEQCRGEKLLTEAQLSSLEEKEKDASFHFHTEC